MAHDPKFRPSVRPPNRTSARPDPIVALEQGKLEDIAQVLDALVNALPRGLAPAESWSLLHDLAAREERTSDLAFAYERLVLDR
jgi:hypothetical protein